MNYSSIGLSGPSGFSNHYRFIGISLRNAIIIMSRIGHCFMNIFVLPHRICMNGNKIYLYNQRFQFVVPWNIVFAKSNRLFSPFFNHSYITNNLVNRDIMICPFYYSFISCRKRENYVGILVRQFYQFPDLFQIIDFVLLEFFF